VYSLSRFLIVISSFCFNDVSSLYVLVLLSSSRKNKTNRKAINELYDKTCKSTTYQNEIMEIEVNYYFFLYKSTNADNEKLEKYIESTKVQSKLSNNESEKCEGDHFTLDLICLPFVLFSVQFI
jgi:hypothetical protein